MITLTDIICCSVGAHVRDAAAYVCWAFARAYTAADMLESIAVLAPALLVTACYDREVSLRDVSAIQCTLVLPSAQQQPPLSGTCMFILQVWCQLDRFAAMLSHALLP